MARAIDAVAESYPHVANPKVYSMMRRDPRFERAMKSAEVEAIEEGIRAAAKDASDAWEDYSTGEGISNLMHPYFAVSDDIIDALLICSTQQEWEEIMEVAREWKSKKKPTEQELELIRQVAADVWRKLPSKQTR